jgi:hypothetical protein
MEELVEAAVDGYNVTIFAFGQTGSGKTHTMLGPRLGRLGDGLLDPAQAARYGHHYHQQQHHAASSVIGEEEGVVLRCLHQQYKLLDAWAAEHPGGVWGVDVSCCEIYNETITDMLGHDKTRQLQVGPVWAAGQQQAAGPTCGRQGVAPATSSCITSWTQHVCGVRL